MVIDNAINSHLSSTSFHIINNASRDGITNVIFGHETKDHHHHHHHGDDFMKQADSVTCVCIGVEGRRMDDVGEYIDMIMQSYVDGAVEDTHHHHDWFTHHQWYKDLKHTCTLYDASTQNLWMISDTIGSSPLWYSFPDHRHDNGKLDFIVSSDLILANRLGFEYLTPLGPGQVVAVDLNVNEVVLLHQWQSDLPKHPSYDDLHNAKLYAYRLMSSSLHTVSNYHGVDDDSIDIEIDPMNPSSLLLDCTLNAMGSKYNTRMTQAIVSDSIIPTAERFSLIMKDVSDPRSLMTNVWAPKFIRTAADRWNLCANSVSKTIASFDSGMFSRPLDVYLQNLFCSILGVRILYPFRGLDFQLKSWGTGHPYSYFHNALDVLRGPFSCESYVSRTYSSSGIVQGAYEAKQASHSSLGNLWQVASKHASHDNYLVLVLATSGYNDLLQNFLCSTSKLNSKHIVVVTPNEDISDIATAAGIGYIMSPSWRNAGINITIADFGTLLYQELILFRTETVMNLLLLGFNPVIADIDTVWLEDPLKILRLEQTAQKFDVAVTNDRGEVCGCFIALQNTVDSLVFWRQVSRLHRQLLIQGRQVPESTREFSDSEQKILTNLLLHKGYNKRLLVCVLSSTDFPSGYDFFNLRNSINDDTIGPPVIVHNNYIIGKGIKKIRFARYNLWRVGSLTEPLQCNYDPLPRWTMMADLVEKNIKIPILSLILPIHNSMISTPLLMAQAHTEGSEFNVSTGRFWLETSPPNFIRFETLGVYQLEVKKSNNINSLTIILDDTSFAVSADVGVNRSVFSFDRDGSCHEAANENVLKTKRLRSDSDIEPTRIKCDLCEPQKLEEEYVASAGSDENAVSFRLEYAIKVLAYNRPASLSRLLRSLADADYLGHTISLEIFVDYPSRDEDYGLVKRVQEIATDFVWAHGSKQLTFREENYGLARQWFLAWSPTLNNEVAFVLEDDLEVSPLFFAWSHRALLKYYANDEQQRLKQMQLLEAVMRHIQSNGTSQINDEFPSTIEEFVTMTAGDPIMYGICLQRQHLDPARYPKVLEIRNGHKPFLYSLIGSWGPLLLPSPWLAFRAWWSWKWEDGRNNNLNVDIKTENTVVNHFLNNNPGIWTPWMVRFAFETGTKCLYPNLPGNLSLVLNHRERGENYDVTLGPDSSMLSRNDVDHVRNLISGNDYKNASFGQRFIAQTPSARFLIALHSAINYLPSISFLAEWQFDLNLRRAGSLGSDRLLTLTTHDNRNNELQMANETITSAAHWYSASVGSDNLILMSNEHWVEIIGALEANLLVGATVLHLGLSPLIKLLTNRYPLHVVVTLDDIQEGESDDSNERLQWVKLGTDTDHHHIPSTNFDIVIVHLPSFKDESFKRLLKYMTFEYLLVLSNSCSGSPTDLHFERFDGTRSYSLVEDVCAEADLDVGGSLFRQVLRGTEEEWYAGRYILSRRIKTSTEILVTRHVKTTNNHLFV